MPHSFFVVARVPSASSPRASASMVTGARSVSSTSWDCSWWAHVEFTRIDITPTILRKKIEDSVRGACAEKGTRTPQIGRVESDLAIDPAVYLRRGWGRGRTGTDPADFACGAEHAAPSLLCVALCRGRPAGVFVVADDQ